MRPRRNGAPFPSYFLHNTVKSSRFLNFPKIWFAVKSLSIIPYLNRKKKFPACPIGLPRPAKQLLFHGFFLHSFPIRDLQDCDDRNSCEAETEHNDNKGHPLATLSCLRNTAYEIFSFPHYIPMNLGVQVEFACMFPFFLDCYSLDR